DVWARLANASLAEAVGEPERVIAVLEPLEDGPRDDAAPMFAALWLPRLAGALLDVGRTDDARRHTDLLATLVHRRNGELAVVAATMRARLAAHDGDAGSALKGFEQAESSISPDTPVLERFHLHRHHGRQLLALGRL